MLLTLFLPHLGLPHASASVDLWEGAASMDADAWAPLDMSSMGTLQLHSAGRLERTLSESDLFDLQTTATGVPEEPEPLFARLSLELASQVSIECCAPKPIPGLSIQSSPNDAATLAALGDIVLHLKINHGSVSVGITDGRTIKHKQQLRVEHSAQGSMRLETSCLLDCLSHHFCVLRCDVQWCELRYG